MGEGVTLPPTVYILNLKESVFRAQKELPTAGNPDNRSPFGREKNRLCYSHLASEASRIPQMKSLRTFLGRGPKMCVRARRARIASRSEATAISAADPYPSRPKAASTLIMICLLNYVARPEGPSEAPRQRQ